MGSYRDRGTRRSLLAPLHRRRTLASPCASPRLLHLTVALTLLLPRPTIAAGEEAHGDRRAEARAFTVAQFERFGVRVATAGPGAVDVGVELPGEVRPAAERIAHLAARFPGVVREVRRHVGDVVRAGDVLAVVESDTLVPFPLRTAIDGTILDQHVTPGESVTPQRPAFVVADLSTVWVDIDVYQQALPRVRVGQPAVIAAIHGTAEATGTISYVAPVVDQATRMARARVVLANPEGVWRPGLFVTATVLDPAHVPVVVTRRALQTLGGRTVVFVVIADRFEPRAVTVGQVGRSQVEITAGLAPGDRFADEQAFLVKAELGKGESGEHDH
jgi:cobalt-zinc-cadmium efflux system membrane fusion protein